MWRSVLRTAITRNGASRSVRLASLAPAATRSTCALILAQSAGVKPKALSQAQWRAARSSRVIRLSIGFAGIVLRTKREGATAGFGQWGPTRKLLSHNAGARELGLIGRQTAPSGAA